MQTIGTHISKSKHFITSLKNFYDMSKQFQKPCQIFTGSPTVWGRPSINSDDEYETIKYIKDNNLDVFVHSLYLCNIAKPFQEFEKAYNCLKWEFETGSRLGFKGIVIHCGKYLKLSKEDGLNNMYQNMISLLPFIDPECPFLLETSAGQGTELLRMYDDFSSFYNRFNNVEKEKIKICIDTCHVFAAGNDPLEFLQNWDRDNPNSLKLVHLNDSKFEFGKCKDRHAFPGKGYIGLEKMLLIIKWCNDRNIPMVLE